MTQFVNVSFFCVPVHEDTTEIIGGYAFGYIERYEALVKHIAKKKKGKKFLYFQ